MTTPLRLHYAPDNASLIVRLALEEARVPYETALVDRAAQAQSSPAYRAINPAGLIPALETPDGPVFETGAILLWVGERYRDHLCLVPLPADTRRGDFLKWLFYLSNTVHANLRMTFYPDKYIGPDPSLQAALRTGARGTLRTSLTLLNDLAARPDGWLSGAGLSALDLYLCGMLRWMALYPKDDTGWFSLSRWPHLYDLAARIETRPSVAALCRAEGMAPRPFTRPQPPNPPEGVAL